MSDGKKNIQLKNVEVIGFKNLNKDVNQSAFKSQGGNGFGGGFNDANPIDISTLTKSNKYDDKLISDVSKNMSDEVKNNVSLDDILSYATIMSRSILGEPGAKVMQRMVVPAIKGGERVLEGINQLGQTVQQSTFTDPKESAANLLRGTGKVLSGGFQTALSVIPQVAMFNLVMPDAIKIGESIGGETGAKIVEKIAPFIFGLPVGVASLGSDAISYLVDESGLLDGLNEEDRALTKDIIRDGSFLGLMRVASVGKNIIRDKVQNKFLKDNVKFIEPKLLKEPPSFVGDVFGENLRSLKTPKVIGDELFVSKQQVKHADLLTEASNLLQKQEYLVEQIKGAKGDTKKALKNNLIDINKQLEDINAERNMIEDVILSSDFAAEVKAPIRSPERLLAEIATPKKREDIPIENLPSNLNFTIATEGGPKTLTGKKFDEKLAPVLRETSKVEEYASNLKAIEKAKVDGLKDYLEASDNPKKDIKLLQKTAKKNGNLKEFQKILKDFRKQDPETYKELIGKKVAKKEERQRTQIVPESSGKTLGAITLEDAIQRIDKTKKVSPASSVEEILKPESKVIDAEQLKAKKGNISIDKLEQSQRGLDLEKVMDSKEVSKGDIKTVVNIFDAASKSKMSEDKLPIEDITKQIEEWGFSKSLKEYYNATTHISERTEKGLGELQRKVYATYIESLRQELNAELIKKQAEDIHSKIADERVQLLEQGLQPDLTKNDKASQIAALENNVKKLNERYKQIKNKPKHGKRKTDDPESEALIEKMKQTRNEIARIKNPNIEPIKTADKPNVESLGERTTPEIERLKKRNESLGKEISLIKQEGQTIESSRSITKRQDEIIKNNKKIDKLNQELKIEKQIKYHVVKDKNQIIDAYRRQNKYAQDKINDINKKSNIGIKDKKRIESLNNRIKLNNDNIAKLEKETKDKPKKNSIIEKADEIIKNSPGRLNSNPLDVYAAMTIKGAYYFGKGIIRAGEWKRKMLDEYGDKITPKQMLMIWNDVQKRPDLKQTGFAKTLPQNDIKVKIKNTVLSLNKPIDESSSPIFVGSAKTYLDSQISSMGQYIKKQGSSGIDLVNTVNRVDRESSQWASKLEQLYRSDIKPLSKEQFRKFVNFADKGGTPSDIKVANALESWKRIGGEISNRALELKLNMSYFDTKTKTFKERPFEPLPNHFPHMFDFDKLKRGKFKERFLRNMSKSLKISRPEAERVWNQFLRRNMVKEYGNIERVRQFDVPGWKETKDVIPQYIEKATRRLKEAELFGNKYEIANKMIENINLSGKDYMQAQRFFDRVVGRDVYNFEWVNFSSKINDWQTADKLGLLVLLNWSKSANIPLISGMKQFIKGIIDLSSKYETVKEFGDDAGVLLNNALKSYKLDSGSQLGLGEKVLTYTGVTAQERLLRSLAAWSISNSLKSDLSKLIRKSGKTRLFNKLQRKIDMLGLSDDINLSDAVKSGSFTQKELLDIGFEGARKTQFLSRPQDVPDIISNKNFKLFTLFKSFIFQQTYLIKDAVINEVKHGNIKPLLYLATLFPAFGEIANTLRAVASLNDEKQKRSIILTLLKGKGFGGINLLDRYIEDLTAIGSLGYIYDIVQAASWNVSGLTSWAAGPTISDVSKFANGVVKLANGESVPILKAAARQVPIPIFQQYLYKSVADATRSKGRGRSLRRRNSR